ncbi:hypothetical protein D918_06486, partial [Trichuris suis]
LCCRGGIGRARLTTGQSGLTRSPVASSTGQTRSARFRPNLSMAGKRIEASDELASSSSRGSGQPHRGIRGRGRTQRRGRRGETVIVAAEGIFSEGLAARSPSGQSSSDLGKLRVKERCIRADPTETDEQALDYVMDDSKDVSDDEDVIPPEFVFLDNASAASSAKFEGISELLLKNAEDQLEDRLFLMRFPRALPYLLGWLKPFPEELRVSEVEGHSVSELSAACTAFVLGDGHKERRPPKVYRVVVDESAEDEGVLSYLGETVEKLNCVPDGSSVKKVDYLKEM